MYGKIIFTLALLLPLTAAAQFSTHGTITYDKKFKLKRAVEWEKDYKWAKRFANQLPQDLHTTFTLNFNKNKTQYQMLPDTSEASTSDNWFVKMIKKTNMADKNQVITDFKTDQQKSLKKLFQKAFLISDSIPHFKWKIEDQVRVIAGYPCRKAVTTICDSVVVVAFYSDQIMVSGGPESFNGLPGMILGLAIPRLYTTWFATNVNTGTPKFSKMDLPKKVKKLTLTELADEIRKDTKQWGKSDFTEQLIWHITL